MDVSLFKDLASSGPVWTLLAISISFNYFLIVKIFNLQEKRVEEVSKARDELVAPVSDIDENLRGINSTLKRMQEESPSFQDIVKMVKGVD